MTVSVSRRGLMAGVAGAGAASFIPISAQPAHAALASAPVLTYTRRVGDVEVTTLLDGYFLLEQAWITALSPSEIAAGMDAAWLDTTAAMPLPVTAYLIRQGGNITLMDAGAGGSLGPTAGGLMQILAAVGIAPEAVNRIVISHLHPDHIGGMLAGNAAAFANATVHVSEEERRFWLDPANANAVPAAMQPWFSLAGQVLTAYGDRITPFSGEADLGGGLSAVAMPGHTPGHTGYRISSGASDLLLWADSTALASLQFHHPDTGIVFDTDGTLGAKTRRRVLDMAVTDRLLVSGSHMPFPGFGHVTQRDDAYAWVPEEWKMF